MKAMRHIHLYIYLPFFALLATLSACVGEELSAPKGEGTGYLRLTLGDISGRCFRGGGDEGGNAYVARYVYSRENGFHD